MPVIDLSSLSWQFGSVAPRPWSAESDASDNDIDRVAEWLPATVPGNVRSDLLALGRIDDPFLGDNIESSRWTESVDWWYRARLPLRLDPGRRAFMELEGVDYLSAVFVDGRELGRHEGMFGRQTLEIPPELARAANVELAVRIWGSDALPAYPTSRRERLWGRIAGIGQNSFRPFDDRLATLKRPMSFGWDFAPRLRTMGIWDHGRVIVCGSARIMDLHIQAEPATPVADGGPARVTVHITIDSRDAQTTLLEVDIEPADVSGAPAQQFRFSLRLPAGRSEHRLACDLPAARLWQPWERGAPHLYRAAVRLCTEDPASRYLTPLAEREARFGLRRIEVGDDWQVQVNGEPFFLRGVNWAPVDALPGRAGRERYEPLLRRMVVTGVNFVRVWGGGGREKQAFYDLCDELGLLVWQEFPIACVFLDHLPRAAGYQQLLRREATGIVRSLRNHPSIFLWCGGNEFSPSRNRHAVEIMAEVAVTEDGQRPFVAASPGPGDAHNWLVWHGLAPLAAYRQEEAAMVSEFGLQAAPAVESLRQFLPEDALWPPGAGWEHHNADVQKLTRYAQWFRVQEAGDAGLARFVEASQRAQAAGLQVLIEHLRRRKGRTGGLAVWQWNEPWPSICWSVIDYFGRPKLACETLQRIMQPVLASLEYPLRRYRAGDLLAGTLWVVNDGLTPLDGCTLRVLLDGVVVQQQTCSVGSSRAARVGALAIHLPKGFGELALELARGNEVLARNVYDLRFHDGGPAPVSDRVRRRIVDLILR
ncbi:MAG: glycoside hydrolase family 2 TIM barrel-domain containing protein [Caldilineales bacterium]